MARTRITPSSFPLPLPLPVPLPSFSPEMGKLVAMTNSLLPTTCLPSMSLTSTDILLFDTLSNCVLKYLKVSLSTVVIVSSQEDTEAPSETKTKTVNNFDWFIHQKWGIFPLNTPQANMHLSFFLPVALKLIGSPKTRK